VIERPPGPPGGATGEAVSHSAEAPLAVGVDVGGTKIDARLVGAQGDVLAHARSATPAAGGPTVVAEIATLVAAVTADRNAAELAGVGIGAAGIIDPETGDVLDATDAIPAWKGVRLAADVAAQTGLRARAINDVHAHALGESVLAGLPRGASLLLIAVGTGVGGAFVSDGEVVRGTHGAAGHFGHVASPHAVGLVCPCGGRGHAEASGSGPAILETYRRLGGTAVDTESVAALAQDGDERAQSAVGLSATTVGCLVGGLVNSFDPDLVVVSGGASRIPGWWQTFERVARQEVLPLLASVALRPSADPAAACIGAASLVFGKEAPV